MNRRLLLTLVLGGLLLAATIAVGADPWGSVAAGAEPSAALGAEPSAAPTMDPQAVLEGGDLRTDGEGPGLVGNPLLILGAVVLLGVATALVTVFVVRLFQRD